MAGPHRDDGHLEAPGRQPGPRCGRQHCRRRPSHRRVHGGSTKAVYAYSVGDYDWWATQLGRPLAPGTFGDNLTVENIDLTAAVVGEKWRVGSALLRVTEPRIPCFKLGIRLGDEAFVRRFADGARPGTYLAIEESGDVGTGDPIHLLCRPGHAITIGTVERAHHGAAHLLPSLVDLDDLSAPWRAWARRRLARRH